MPHIRDSISRWLSEIQKAIKEHTDTTRKNQQADARERQQQSESVTKTEVRLPVEITEYYSSEQGGRRVKDRRDRVRLCLEIGGVLTAIAIAVFTLLSLRTFNKQLQEMRNQTEISERPWLSIEVSPNSDFIWVNGKQAAVTIKVSIKNVGKSIAKDVQVDAKMFPSDVLMPISVEAQQNQNALCDQIHLNPIGKFDLFPSDSPTDSLVSVSALPPPIAAKSITVSGEKPRTFAGFYIVGCVSYRFSFGTTYHQTRFAYHLVGPPAFGPDKKIPIKLPDGTMLMSAFEVGVTAPKGGFAMMRELFAQNEAN